MKSFKQFLNEAKTPALDKFNANKSKAKYTIIGSKVHINKADYNKQPSDYKAKRGNSHMMLAMNPKTGATELMPVVFVNESINKSHQDMFDTIIDAMVNNKTHLDSHKKLNNASSAMKVAPKMFSSWFENGESKDEMDEIIGDNNVEYFKYKNYVVITTDSMDSVPSQVLMINNTNIATNIDDTFDVDSASKLLKLYNIIVNNKG